MNEIWIAISTIATVAAVYLGFFYICRPTYIYVSDTEAIGRYFIVNKLTGNIAFFGQTFKTREKAIRRLVKKISYLDAEQYFEIRQIISQTVESEEHDNDSN